MLNEILILIMSVAGLVVAYRFLIRRVTVREGHLGLYYRKGIYMRQLEAGSIVCTAQTLKSRLSICAPHK